jgi:uncharacterized RDD family membrane protein YckC
VAYCIHCGEELTAGAAFCRSCGQPTGVMPRPERSRYAGFWRRVAGSLIDGLVLIIPIAILAGVLIAHGYRFGFHYHPHAPSGEPVLTGPGPRTEALLELVLTLPAWLYAALLTSSAWQATVGQRALGMRVTDLEGRRITFARATGRYFASIVSSWTLGIGYLIMIWTERKQTLHDLIAGTVVVHDRD